MMRHDATLAACSTSIRNRRTEFVRLMQEHGVVQNFESQIYRKDGTIIWISENARAVRDASGKILYYEGMVEDITARKEAEEKLRFSENRFRSVWENSSDGMRLTDEPRHHAGGQPLLLPNRRALRQGGTGWPALCHRLFGERETWRR